MSQGTLDAFIATLWERPTSDLLMIYSIRGCLRDGTPLGKLVLDPTVTYSDATRDQLTGAARAAVADEIDRRFPVIRCVGCGGKPHRDPVPIAGGFCHGSPMHYDAL